MHTALYYLSLTAVPTAALFLLEFGVLLRQRQIQRFSLPWTRLASHAAVAAMIGWLVSTLVFHAVVFGPYWWTGGDHWLPRRMGGPGILAAVASAILSAYLAGRWLLSRSRQNPERKKPGLSGPG
ncbi:hypothetical protein [Lysobacter antibioticus]|uniref:Transmembrane protein n=1 Tax=Lysobacter antibioticus TaxID=84531 RepID=A0A0S2FA29_LYSAN|nr:hypothetical protein [Lysobacter antibioticus]ALN80398.1 hypothetical protein LA76x_2264 [Lysobacter antibioticus]